MFDPADFKPVTSTEFIQARCLTAHKDTNELPQGAYHGVVYAIKCGTVIEFRSSLRAEHDEIVFCREMMVHTIDVHDVKEFNDPDIFTDHLHNELRIRDIDKWLSLIKTLVKVGFKLYTDVTC